MRCRDPERQARKILALIQHAARSHVDLLLFPELVAPFSHLPQFEKAVEEAEGEMVVALCYEHTPFQELLPLIPEEELRQHRVSTDAGPRMTNFCRILIKTEEELHVFTQLKLTPFSGEFSLSARETLFCGHILHMFITDWGNFLFLICKDYVGEVGGTKRIPMFDFLKSLTERGLHYIFVSALNPEPGAFVHAARAFYYLQEKSSQTFTVFLNTAELGETAILFPTRPHPGVKPTAELDLLPLFEGKAGWGTQLRFPHKGERIISGVLVRLDKYKPLPTKEIFSPVRRIEQEQISALGIEPDYVAEPPGPAKAERKRPPTNLPTPATPFVGRKEELSALGELLADPYRRLITLVGPGGMGKTRLALEAAAREAGSFAHGAFFVPLASLDSVEQLVPAIADSLGFAFYEGGDPEVQLLDYLREKEMLLVLDNFEHLVEGAALVAEIVRAAPGVKLLVTSRERLALQGEWLVEVRGLDEDSAVALFVQGAGRVCPGFSPSEEDQRWIRRICSMVDQMPLAIELAASWVRMLTPEEIAAEIQENVDFLAASYRDIPARHRSLRAVFDHSWRLLVDEERAAFRRLSVFRGSFGREAAAEVAGVSLRTLSSLVDKSLLARGRAGRYELHELLRAYGQEKLGEDLEEEREVRRRHCLYYAAFARQRAEELTGERAEMALQALRDELENLRAAWDFALETEDDEELARLLEGLYRFYEVGGRYREGSEVFGEAIAALRGRGTKGILLAKVLARTGRFRHRLGASGEARTLLEEGLALARAAGDDREIAFILTALAEVTAFSGDYPKAEELLKDALELARAAGDRFGVAWTLNTLGTVSWNMGAYERAKAFYQEGLAIERERGDLRGMAITLNNLGIIHGLLGELKKARELFTQSLSISEKLGDLPSMSRCLNNLGIVATKLGDLVQAKRFHARSLAIEREVGNKAGVAGSLSNMGDLAYRMGAYDEAKELYTKSLTERRETGDSMGEVISLMNLCEVCLAQKEDEGGTNYLREALGKALEIGTIPLLLGCLAKMARILTRQGEGERAAELLGLVLNHPALEIDTKEEVEDLLPRLRSLLSPEALERAMQRGPGLDPERIARELLAD
ncbi:tetratricopeptide repeat protein [Candidatus Bipolaricaulota sp. J31]